jgi:hypothetical protein
VRQQGCCLNHGWWGRAGGVEVRGEPEEEGEVEADGQSEVKGCEEDDGVRVA